MKLTEFSNDQQLDELLPAVGAALGAASKAVGGAVVKGAQAVGGAMKAGAQAAGQASPQTATNTAPDPKALAMAAMQAKERKDNITQQMKDIDTQITDLQKQKSELQKELATVK